MHSIQNQHHPNPAQYRSSIAWSESCGVVTTRAERNRIDSLLVAVELESWCIEQVSYCGSVHGNTCVHIIVR